MNCQEFWNGEAQALDHLKECRNCLGRFERHQKLASGLNALGAQMRRVGAPHHLERRLVAAYRAQAEFSGMPPRGAWLAAATWAAGVAATVALAVFLMNGHQPQRTHRITRSMTQLAAVEIPADADGMADFRNEFIALPNTEDLAPNDEMNMVRVELPRSSMIALGFAVSEERASEPVEADVMLGADGVARAVRFLEY